MTPAHELDRLLPAVVDGELSEADQLHLAALLRDDPALQGRYLDHLMLDSMLRWEKPAAAPRAKVSRYAIARRVCVALAACLLVVAGLWLIGLAGRAEARSDLVERLADWSLSIAAAPTPDDREQWYREQAEAFTDELARAKLPASDRELASALLANARTLSAPINPLDEAEQLDRMAEQMLDWMWASAETDSRRSQAMDRHYLRFVERSQASLKKVSVGADESKRKRMKRIHDRIGGRTDARFYRETERFRHKRKR